MDEKEFRLLGFNFLKILAERRPDFKGELPNIESNIDIKSIEQQKTDLLKEETLKLEFNFVLNYKDLGKIEMNGNLIVMFSLKISKQILEDWKEKRLPENIRLPILNLILQRSSLKALQLEEEIGLPLHVRLPTLQQAGPSSNSK
jgi:hypothetical protein